MVFDELDRALLRELQHYPLQSSDELASVVGVLPTEATERVQTMIERGVILGYRTEVDLKAIGRPVQALVAVRVRASASGAMDDFREWAAAQPETLNLYITSGSCDFFVHVAVPTTHDLYSFITDGLTKQPGVIDARTNIVFEHIRSYLTEPVDDNAANRHHRPSTSPETYPV